MLWPEIKLAKLSRIWINLFKSILRSRIKRDPSFIFIHVKRMIIQSESSKDHLHILTRTNSNKNSSEDQYVILMLWIGQLIFRMMTGSTNHQTHFQKNCNWFKVKVMASVRRKLNFLMNMLIRVKPQSKLTSKIEIKKEYWVQNLLSSVISHVTNKQACYHIQAKVKVSQPA